jgi:hypothetical protein
VIAFSCKAEGGHLKAMTSAGVVRALLGNLAKFEIPPTPESGTIEVQRLIDATRR